MSRPFAEGLVLDDLAILDGEDELLRVSATITPGEILTVMGPSGSGKSSLINAIAGFLQTDFTASGRVILHGEDITTLPPGRRHVGVLFQDALLFPHFSVIENVIFALPPEVKGAGRGTEALALLDAVGLKPFADRDPETLSGGQKARVALVRTLAARPRALLLDEPFSRLDQQLRESVRELVFAEVIARDLPALLVTHDPADAEAAGGRILTL